MAADIEDINDKNSSLRIEAPHSQPDLTRNLIISNLPETSIERMESKVNALFRDGLKINGVSVESVERKVSRVVVVKIKSMSDKKTLWP